MASKGKAPVQERAGQGHDKPGALRKSLRVLMTREANRLPDHRRPLKHSDCAGCTSSSLGPRTRCLAHSTR